MIRSLRAQAIIATLNGLDAVSKRLNISLKTGLQPRTAQDPQWRPPRQTSGFQVSTKVRIVLYQHVDFLLEP
ncbi:MAG: hypothetical protein Q4D38_14090, partial [Planctomycetia bacterium]|nr:hypothetical protein [Planctomycetia bacterium]